MVTTKWDVEYDFAQLGLIIKVKNVDPVHHVFVGFTVPTLLQHFTMGVTEIELDILLMAPQILNGLFEIKVGYTIVRNDGTKQGTLVVFRRMENEQYSTKIVIKENKAIILDLGINTEMRKERVIFSSSIGGMSYSLTLSRVRGTTLIVSFMVDGIEYTWVISPSVQDKKISIHSSNGKSAIHDAQINYNPISSEWGVYVNGDIFGPLDCRFILQKDLKFAQIIVSQNNVNYVYFNMEGKVEMANLLPKYFKYAITYDLFQGRWGEGRAKVNYNALDVEKVFSLSMAPKIGHAYDFEMKVKIDDDYSFDISHELMSGKDVYYTASHKNIVAINTPKKWMSLMKDKCVLPKTSPLYMMVKGTYLGELFHNMHRQMSLDIDWTTRIGYLYKMEYSDTIVDNGAKHLVVSLSTKASPFTFQLYYPNGPAIGGIHCGLRELLGQDALHTEFNYATDKQEVLVKTDIDNLRVKLVMPNLTKKLSVVITHNKLNEKAFECVIYKDGPAVKVNMFSSFFTPKVRYLCTPTAPATSCQWTSQLNFDINLAAKISGVLPVHSLVMSLTKDFMTLIEVQNNMKQSPYFLRVNCPLVLPKPLNVQITNMGRKQIIVKLKDYLPDNVVVDIVGTLHVIKYEGHEIGYVDLDLADKMVAVGLGLIPTPIWKIRYVGDDLLKNRVTVNIDLPIVGKVLTFTVDWMIKDVLNFDLEVDVVGTVPVVGDFTVNNVLTTAVAFPKGRITYTATHAFTKGLVTYLPEPVENINIIYDIPAKTVEGTAQMTVSGRIYGISVKESYVSIMSGI